MKRFLIFVALVALAVFAVFRWNEHRLSPQTFTPATGGQIDLKEVPSLAAMDRETTRLVKAVVPSVVSITTSRTVQGPQIIDPFEYFFGQRRGRVPQQSQQTSLGSGVIVSKEGHILTNHHVIANTDAVKISLADGRDFTARIVGTDEASDIAVLKIEASGIVPLPLGDSDNVKTGQMVFAIGNPFGLQETVTQGIISATGRRVFDESATEFFQTNTIINPGNSGGPLINIQGEIIGINNSIGNFSGKGTFEGVGFAIPSNVVRHAMESILKTGRVSRGYLGVAIQELTPELAAQLGLPAQTGALITAIAPGSPAEKAGLKPGDIISSINGKPFKNSRALLRQVSGLAVKSTVELRILRDKKEEKINVTIEEQPADFRATLPARPQTPPSPQLPPAAPVIPENNPLSGIAVSEIPSAQRANLPENIQGVLITAIAPNAPAAGKLQVGDVIEQIGRQPIGKSEDFQQIASTLEPNRRVALSICRGKLRTFVVVP